jgi:hypothetical protein
MLQGHKKIGFTMGVRRMKTEKEILNELKWLKTNDDKIAYSKGFESALKWVLED